MELFSKVCSAILCLEVLVVIVVLIAIWWNGRKWDKNKRG